MVNSPHKGPVTRKIFSIRWRHHGQRLFVFVSQEYSGPWYNINMLSYQYRQCNYGDKSVVRSFYLHNGFPIPVRWNLDIESDPRSWCSHNIAIVNSGCGSTMPLATPAPLQWRHNWSDGVSNPQPHHCLINCLFRCRSKKTSKLCFTGLCAGISLVISEFPAQMASNAENVFIWWRHDVINTLLATIFQYFWLPDDAKTLPESILTYPQWLLAAFTWGPLHRNCWKISINCSSWIVNYICEMSCYPLVPMTFWKPE